jgi:hypothetical protein
MTSARFYATVSTQTSPGHCGMTYTPLRTLILRGRAFDTLLPERAFSYLFQANTGCRFMIYGNLLKL